MSRYIATRAIRGANLIVAEAEEMLQRALAEKGPETPVAFPNTAYFLPVILGMTGIEVSKLGDLVPVLQRARELLHPVPPDHRWTPYLGETLDCGMATLLAEETIEAIRFVYKLEPQRIAGFHVVAAAAAGGSFTSPEFTPPAFPPAPGAGGFLNGPIDDVQLRTWGIQLVDGRMPGFAAIVGCAKSNEVAVKIVRELQRRNILCFLSGNVNGRSIIHQLLEEGVELGYDTYTVPFGLDTISAIYALGFATRSALTFGGLKGGQAREILLYNKNRVFAFVLALGEVDDLKYATAAGAINFGFPVIADTVIPQILPTGITTYEHVISMPFNEIPGKDDLERAEQLVQKCIEVRGVKVRVTEVPIPVPYGSAFEGEVVRRKDMRVEFGGKNSRAFEYLRMADWDEVQDGKITVVGPDFSDVPMEGSMDMGIVIEVAGRKMQKDFEPVLERQVHYFINGASGVQHIGQRDITWIRISKAAAEKGFTLRHFGDILHARYHADFGAIVDKCQVTIYTDPEQMRVWLERARQAYQERNVRLANMTDESVDTFYTCTLCQSFAPTHVCIVSPERLGLCGAYNWLDCRASYEINPTGPNQPIQKGAILDREKGYMTGVNEVAQQLSQGKVSEVAMYSIMENPMTACLTADAEILTDAGPMRIGDFVRRWRETRPDVAIWTLNEQGRMTRSRLLGVHENPAPEKLVRIVTKSGQELILTPNHEVAVDRWSMNGHGPWRRADEIEVGDRVYSLRRLPIEVTVRHPAKRLVFNQIRALPAADPDKSQEQVLPFAAGRTLAELPESQTVVPPSTLFYYRTGRSRPVAEMVQRVIDEAPETAPILSPWLTADYFLDTVVAVETIESAGKYDQVYNLSLLDINSYIANGIHVKNCGCFECIAMVIPEANGIMVVSREDPSMTPAGMTFSTLAGMAGGGLQTPGVMGIGKYYLTSKKFISADGGFKRVVWMSSVLKETMAEELKAVAEREGDPDLIERIADERVATTVDELLPWLEEHNHPALTMPPLF